MTRKKTISALDFIKRKCPPRFEEIQRYLKAGYKILFFDTNDDFEETLKKKADEHNKTSRS